MQTASSANCRPSHKSRNRLSPNTSHTRSRRRAFPVLPGARTRRRWCTKSSMRLTRLRSAQSLRLATANAPSAAIPSVERRCGTTTTPHRRPKRRSRRGKSKRRRRKQRKEEEKQRWRQQHRLQKASTTTTTTTTRRRKRKRRKRKRRKGRDRLILSCVLIASSDASKRCKKQWTLIRRRWISSSRSSDADWSLPAASMRLFSYPCRNIRSLPHFPAFRWRRRCCNAVSASRTCRPSVRLSQTSILARRDRRK